MCILLLPLIRANEFLKDINYEKDRIKNNVKIYLNEQDTIKNILLDLENSLAALEEINHELERMARQVMKNEDKLNHLKKSPTERGYL